MGPESLGSFRNPDTPSHFFVPRLCGGPILPRLPAVRARSHWEAVGTTTVLARQRSSVRRTVSLGPRVQPAGAAHPAPSLGTREPPGAHSTPNPLAYKAQTHSCSISEPHLCLSQLSCPGPHHCKPPGLSQLSDTPSSLTSEPTNQHCALCLESLPRPSHGCLCSATRSLLSCHLLRVLSPTSLSCLSVPSALDGLLSPAMPPTSCVMWGTVLNLSQFHL